MSTMKAIVVVASTRAARGDYEDASGPILAAFLHKHGLDTQVRVVADADIHGAVEQALAQSPAVLLTSGGTGITADDQTIEALRPHLDRELPGLSWAFYAASAAVPTAVLSRVLAGTSGRTFALAVPGSPGAARDTARVLEPVLDHLLAQLGGSHEH